MESFVKADVFFFVTAIAVVAVSVFIMVICIYVVRILADAKHIAGAVRKESDEVLADVSAVRHIVERQGKRIGRVFDVAPKKRVSRK